MSLPDLPAACGFVGEEQGSLGLCCCVWRGVGPGGSAPRFHFIDPTCFLLAGFLLAHDRPPLTGGEK